MKRVFIHCPFDDAYERMFDALVFSVLHCGFFPCSAAEALGSGRQRFERILDLIRTCPFAIHDLSRTETTGPHRLPRFNMPFELGLFVGALEFGNRRQRAKDFLVFERRRGDCKKCCSDLGGVDPVAHANKPRRAIRHVRNWLNAHAGGKGVSGPNAIDADFRSFRTDLPHLLETWNLQEQEMTFEDFRKAAQQWLDARRQV